MQAQVLALRVHWATGSPLHSTSHSRVSTGPIGWLLAERPLPPTEAAEQTPTKASSQDEESETKYWVSTLPLETELSHLVTLAHARWVIEQFYEDAKQECGLDDSQGRRWDGLHRHLALVMLAYSFLMWQRLQLPLPAGEDVPPLRHTSFSASCASADPHLGVPGSRALAHPDRSDQDFPSSEKLTK